MLPKTLLSDPGKGLVPRYLDERDHPWLRALLDVYRAFDGRRRRELDERLREGLLPEPPAPALARAVHVLERFSGERTVAPRPPREVRAVLFGEAAGGGNRDAAIKRAAERLELSEEDVLDALFADIPAERRLTAPALSLDPTELALRTNLALAQGLVAHAQLVRIEAVGNARDLVRYARLRGLLCVARPGSDPDRLVLELSGPLALFRRTRVYGRALAGLVPRLPWCRDFDLRADVELGDARQTLRIQPGDPVFPSAEPKRFDSKLEERFAADFAKAAPDWELIREPRAVPADGTLIFPDFLLQHRRDPARRFYLEIVGFWTEAYLATKLRRLAAADLQNLILCVDATRAAGRTDIPAGAAVIRFRRRVDATQVLARIDSIGSDAQPRKPSVAKTDGSACPTVTEASRGRGRS